jgi:hypothetical protein
MLLLRPVAQVELLRRIREAMGTEHLEDVEETLHAPSVEDWERSEYEDICVGVLGEGTERNRTQQLQCRQLGRDLEELSNLLTEPMTGTVFPCSITDCHSHRHQGHKAQGESHDGRPKEEAEYCLNPFSCC